MGLFSALFPPSLAPAQVTEQLLAGELVALDVREPHEFKSGRIANSKNIPAGALPAYQSELDPDRRYLLICRSGARSAQATRMLRKAGFDAMNLKGGVMGWQRAGLPLETKPGRRSGRR